MKNTKEKISKNLNKIAFTLSLILILYLTLIIYQQRITIHELHTKNLQKTTSDTKYEIHINIPENNYTKGYFSNTLYLPAVLRDNKGVSAYAKASIDKGNGNIWVNINNIMVNPDTQQSIRKAVLVASEITNTNLSSFDIYFDIYADAAILEGPSAGAALTILSISLIKNQKLKKDVMITGSVNSDGTIGFSGKILEKAKAARQRNASLFLVPEGFSTELNLSTKEFCHTYGTYEFCDNDYIIKKYNISKEAKIPVKEVKTIEEAYQYFIKEEDK